MKVTFNKRKVACLVGGLILGMSADALAATVTSSATATVTGHAPTLSPGQITYEDKNSNGVLDTGDIVKVDSGNPFVFADVDGDTAVAETYSWQIGGTEVGANDSYTVKDTDLGKGVTLFVTPHTNPDITDPADGVAVQSTTAVGRPDLPIAGGDLVLSVTISGGTGAGGSPVVNDTLTANPTCTKACGTLNYQWQVEDSVGSGLFTDITGANNSTWQVTTSTQKRKIQVIVSNP
ncbi:ZirU family protein [Citrobacter freundii]|uniref:ZirU family protein n=1 Tax=Citrobacter freundii TaxID=546 RepID=UPI00242E23DA|nr:ZirU family protein [Citrobacter freundii]WFW58463.1 ZirU family protein [Citrobacter freundii]